MGYMDLNAVINDILKNSYDDVVIYDDWKTTFIELERTGLNRDDIIKCIIDAFYDEDRYDPSSLFENCIEVIKFGDFLYGRPLSESIDEVGMVIAWFRDFRRMDKSHCATYSQEECDAKTYVFSYWRTFLKQKDPSTFVKNTLQRQTSCLSFLITLTSMIDIVNIDFTTKVSIANPYHLRSKTRFERLKKQLFEILNELKTSSNALVRYMLTRYSPELFMYPPTTYLCVFP